MQDGGVSINAVPIGKIRRAGLGLVRKPLIFPPGIYVLLEIPLREKEKLAILGHTKRFA